MERQFQKSQHDVVSWVASSCEKAPLVAMHLRSLKASVEPNAQQEPLVKTMKEQKNRKKSHYC